MVIHVIQKTLIFGFGEPSNAVRLIKTVADFGLGMLGLQQEDLLDTENIIQLGYEPNRIGCITNLHESANF
jgi:hypothetical protein